MTNELENRITALEDKAFAAVEIAREARNTASMAELSAHNASHLADDIHARLSGHGRTLEALRETQVEQGQWIAELRDLRGKVDRLEGEMREGFTKVNLGVSQILATLNNIGR